MRALTGLLALCVLIPLPVSGQVEIEARGGMSIGSHSSTFAGLEFLPRPSFDLIVKKDWRNLSVILSSSYASFGCEHGFCKGARTIGVRQLSGYAGLEARYGFGWLRGGGGAGMTNILNTSEIGPALFLASGIRYDFGAISLLPGVSYRWMRAGKETITVSADLGISYTIGGIR